MSEEIILYDEVKLEKVQKTGYVSKGFFYGDNEHLAKWNECTHVSCGQCGKPTPKLYTICEDCREKIAIEAWEEAPKKPFNKGEDFFYSDLLEKYYSSYDEVENDCEDLEIDISDLRLYHCDRAVNPSVDLESIYEDCTPEENDPSDMWTDEIQEAADRLNELIEEHPVNCFYPSKIAVKDD
jgi:hypothetical protein